MIEPGHFVTNISSSRGNIVIRYPREDDAPALLEFINGLSREKTFVLFQGEQLTIEQEEAWLADRLHEIASGAAVFLVACHGLQVVGTVAVTLKGLAERHVGVLGISVHQSWRGHGLGGTLLDTVLTEADAQLSGLRIVELGVFGSNQVARRLYASRGFVEHGVLPGGVKHGDDYVDHVLMHRTAGASQ